MKHFYKNPRPECDNFILDIDGPNVYVSYNPCPFDTQVPETALYVKGVWYILNGDFRKEYEKAGDLEGCLKVFRDNIEHISTWSTCDGLE